MVVYHIDCGVFHEHVAALYIYVCVFGGGGCVYSRVSLGNGDDYAALGGGEERQQPQGGRGEGTCVCDLRHKHIPFN